MDIQPSDALKKLRELEASQTLNELFQWIDQCPEFTRQGMIEAFSRRDEPKE